MVSNFDLCDRIHIIGDVSTTRAPAKNFTVSLNLSSLNIKTAVAVAAVLLQHQYRMHNPQFSVSNYSIHKIHQT